MWSAVVRRTDANFYDSVQDEEGSNMSDEQEDITGPISTTLDDALEPIPGCKITWLAGMCPLQGEGQIDGRAFYFRSRHEHWGLSLSVSQDQDTTGVSLGWTEGYVYSERYGRIGQHDAGYMSIGEGVASIVRAARCMQKLLTFQETHGTPGWDVPTALAKLAEYRYTLEHFIPHQQDLVTVLLKAEGSGHLAEFRCQHPDMATVLIRAWQVLQCCTPCSLELPPHRETDGADVPPEGP
jgi:hypothetical protein